MTADGGLFVCVSVFFSSYESDSFIFLIFGPFFVVFDFSFHFCFDLPQVSNCYADWGLITAAGEAYHPGQNNYRYRSDIKSKTFGL